MADDELFDALREALRKLSIASLERQHALPSPVRRQHDSSPGNAVLIDASGWTRRLYLRDFPHEYLVPIPQRMSVTHEPQGPITMPKLPIARFRLHSIEDGEAVYHYAGMR